MSSKCYTAEQLEHGYILIHLPGAEYRLDIEDARKLSDSLDDILLSDDDEQPAESEGE